MVDAQQQVEYDLEVHLQDLFENFDLMFQSVGYNSEDALDVIGSINIFDEYRQWIYESGTWEPVD